MGDVVKVKLLVMGVEHAMAAMLKASNEKRLAYVQINVFKAEKVMTESQRRVPVDTGRLKNSKFIMHNETRRGVVSTLGYRAEYALPVHDIGPDRVQHVVGTWQYLRGPLEEAAPSWEKEVADYVSKAG